MDQWRGPSCDGPRTSIMADMADPIPLDELEARVRRLAELDEEEQFAEAKELILVSKASFQLVRDTVIVGLTRRLTNEETAKYLKISVKTVEAAVTRFNKRRSST